MTSLPEITRHGNALVYPMPPGAALNTYDRVDFYHRDYLASDTYRRAITDPAHLPAAFFAHALWMNSANQRPVGTIPTDSDEQAFMIGLGADVARWRAVAPDATRGYCPVITKDGEPMDRLANETMLAVCYAGWQRQQRHVADNERKKATLRRKRLKEKIREAGLNVEQVQSPEVANLYLAYIDAMDLQITTEAVTAARAALGAGWVPENTTHKLQLVGGKGLA